MRPNLNQPRPDLALTAILQHGDVMDAAQKDAASLDTLAQEIERIDQKKGAVTQATALDLSKAVIEFPALMSLTIPERKCHVPWLSEGGITMAYGPRGVGKTFFTLGLATALTTGGNFLR